MFILDDDSDHNQDLVALFLTLLIFTFDDKIK